MDIALTILKYVTILPMLIQGVEGLFSKGSDKKAAVITSADAILSGLVSTGVISQDTASKYPAATSDLVDAFVKFFNQIGAFQAASTPAK